MTQDRPLRADAARNRAKILEAADAQIVAHGPEVPMEAIAAAAGVAVGTLYRHFPTKQALVAAVIESHLEYMAVEIEAALARVEAGERAADVLFEIAGRVLESAASDKTVKAAASAIGAEYDPGDSFDRMTVASARIVKAAVDDGDLRPDLTVDDLFLVFNTLPTELPADARRRWLTLMLDGFCTGRR
ncbi:TetR/AcrR family transcriptional regulator [Glycomyces buryatensis]|uniref:Helix-turn-helix transcriptional regulator n=1 Tax=Glycomyces buryatensis TaxID=2570927 RepID=A0A4V4HSR9_9ACTN|nr:TetR family transcriptional regulator [Glycomyces buryatensis]THV42766.1 helix-turn-helix transcriptional regulator [Glycomyces buryatensis]